MAHCLPFVTAWQCSASVLAGKACLTCWLCVCWKPSRELCMQSGNGLQLPHQKPPRLQT